MSTKLNSMRFLEKNDVPYDVVEYPDTMRDAEEIAEVLGVPPHLVYKTLVVEAVGVPGAKPCLVMIASNRHLDLTVPSSDRHSTRCANAYVNRLRQRTLR